MSTPSLPNHTLTKQCFYGPFMVSTEKTAKLVLCIGVYAVVLNFFTIPTRSHTTERKQMSSKK